MKQEILEDQGRMGGMENEVQKVTQDNEVLLDPPVREDQQEIQALQANLEHKCRENLYLAHLDLVPLMAMLQRSWSSGKLKSTCCSTRAARTAEASSRLSPSPKGQLGGR